MITVDKMSRIPIYEQLINEFELGILRGEIKKDSQLPSVRVLSQQLGVNPNTMQKAYAELERRGLCYSVPGSGRFITHEAIDRLDARINKRLVEIEAIVSELKLTGVEKAAIDAVVSRIYSNDDASNERRSMK